VNLDEFLVKFKEIKAKGFIESHRTDDTGIGKTLEDLVGIKENCVAGPDFDIYELKSKRKLTSSMMTLFTKVPQPKGANQVLLDAFGYKERIKKPNRPPRKEQPLIDAINIAEVGHPEVSIKEKELHVTVTAKAPNSVGLWLERRGNKIHIANEKGIDVYYEQDYLKAAFEKKYKQKMVYVLAENKKERGKNELFHYTDLYLQYGFSFEGFSEQIDNGVVKLDIRIGHFPNGKPHDHGTGFRIFPRDFPKCFEHIEKLV
jgi:hypothetical protein